MSIFAKLLLVAVGVWPFAVLVGNVRRTISMSFVTAAAIATSIGAVFYYLYGSGRHPHVSTVFLVLFFLWPVALFIAKIREPSLPWRQLWISVPLMSWFTITLAVSMDYPVQGGGGGFGMLVTLVLGWLYMVPFFGFLHLFHIVFRYARTHFTTVA
jgi:hypothetical protein